jgi:hypothetical protein
MRTSHAVVVVRCSGGVADRADILAVLTRGPAHLECGGVAAQLCSLAVRSAREVCRGACALGVRQAGAGITRDLRERDWRAVIQG